MQVDVGGGAIEVIEFAAVDAEELQGLVEVGFGELGLQELGELGEVEGLDEGEGFVFGSTVPCAVEVGVGEVLGAVPEKLVMQHMIV